MTLSIIIVNYNVKIEVEQCLLSVAKAVRDINAEVFLVDNASSDGSLDFLHPRFPDVQFIANNTNEGFAKANNRALKKSAGKYILFLNPDTIVPADCFTKCIRFMEKHNDCGALGVRMINEEGKFLKESKRGFPSPMVSFWKLTGFAAIFPRSKIFAKYYLGHLDENTSHVVDILSGAFMFVKKEILDKTGGFDERFFMYAEDIDLSYRIALAGYRNYYFAGTTITHLKGKSTKKDFKYVKMFYKAMSLFVRKYYGRGAFSFLLDSAIFLRGSVEAGKNLIMRRKQ